MSQTIKLGLSVLLEEKLDFLGGRSVGLITNATGVNENLDTVDQQITSRRHERRHRRGS